MIIQQYEIIGIEKNDITMVSLEVGVPKFVLKNSFEVEIKLKGLYDELPRIKGDTAFEALLNALLFVSNLMSGLQKKGYSIKVAQSGDLWEVDFPKVDLVWTPREQSLDFNVKKC